MQVGDTEYHAALRKWRELYGLKMENLLTFEQAAQLDSLDKELTAAERRHGIRDASSDYTEAIRLAGDLGGVEL